MRPDYKQSLDDQIKELANVCAQQAEALANGVGYLNDTERHAKALLLKNNVETLQMWTRIGLLGLRMPLPPAPLFG